jgi:hypothetical protein
MQVSQRFKARAARTGLSIIFFGAVVGIASGQASTTGSIANTVVDATGGAVPGASVKITDLQSGTTYTTTPSGSGTYVLPPVRPGVYKETVTANGYISAETNNVEIFVGTRAAYKMKLSVGATTETVTVDANGPSLEMEIPCRGKPLLNGQLFDPGAGTANVGGVDCRSETFTNNMIPSARFSPLAVKLVARRWHNPIAGQWDNLVCSWG